MLGVAAALGACSSSSKPASTATTTGGSGGSTATTASTGSSGSSTAATGAPIKVGLICTCSGTFSADLSPGVNVYKAWINTVNGSGGINGHPVELISEDDGGIPGTAITKAQTLVSDKVDAILDISITSSAWAPTISAANIPVVGGNASEEPFITNPDFYPEGETDDALPYSFGYTGKAAGVTRLAYFYCAESASCAEAASSIQAVTASIGVPVVYKAEVSATAPNYTAQCVAAQQANVQAILNGDINQVFQKEAANCNQQNYHPVYISSGQSFDPTMLSDSVLRNNAWYESNDIPYFDTSVPAIQEMTAAVTKYYPGMVNKPFVWSGGSNVYQWASGIMLSDAVKAGGLTASGTPSAAEIVTGLNSFKGDTLQGLSPPLTFVAGQPHTVDCWFTFKVENGVPSMVNNSEMTCKNGQISAP